MTNVLPQAEHRWCARHIYQNWSKKWSGGVLKNKFFICAWSTFEEEFKDNLEKIGEVSVKAAEDLLRYPPHNWCRAYFSSRCKSMKVDNNFSESFNAWILTARFKPIISMLEDIRLQTMNRIKENKKAADRWFNEWSPACMNVFQDNKEIRLSSKVVFNGASGYEIGEGDDKHTVILDQQQCTCRAWELSGIPCSHSICALYHSKIDPMNMLAKWYHKSSYLATYQFPLLPVPGPKFMKFGNYEPIEPPPLPKLPGRPKVKRTRASNESQGNRHQEGHLSRKGQAQECALCHKQGHNRKTCPNKANQV